MSAQVAFTSLLIFLVTWHVPAGEVGPLSTDQDATELRDILQDAGEVDSVALYTYLILVDG